MKIFNVIAILCSLFAVVNGQTAQEYTYEFTLTGIDPGLRDIKVRLDSGTQKLMTCNYDEEDNRVECTATITSETSHNFYYYSYDEYDDIHYEWITHREFVFGNHPCVINIENGWLGLVTERSLQNDVYVYTDTFRDNPPCSVGEVQCGEFVYDRSGFNGQSYDICKSIPVDDISTLKTKLAESSSFNGNCEMST